MNSITETFADRLAAGRALAALLQSHEGSRDAAVLAQPRGGVPVAWETSRRLHLPMDLLLVRKLGVPGQPELAMGAIAGAGAGSLYVDAQAVALHGVTPAQLSEVIERERAELVRREALYLGSRKRVGVAGRTVIVIDDGIATGSTMRAALMALRASQPEWIVVASPVAPPEAQDRIGTAADEFVCLRSPADFASVGKYYQDFSQTTDDEVLALLARRTGCV